MVVGFGKWIGKKILKSKKKSTFIKDKSGTITGVKPGSKIGIENKFNCIMHRVSYTLS